MNTDAITAVTGWTWTRKGTRNPIPLLALSIAADDGATYLLVAPPNTAPKWVDLDEGTVRPA